MGEKIAIEVGESFAQKNEQFKQILGDDYDVRLRNLIEDEIHTVTQQIERQSEQHQANIDPKQIGDEIDDHANDE